MLPALAFLAGLIAAAILLLWLHDKIHATAMESARVELGRELLACRAWLSRHGEASRALEIAAEMVLQGGPVDGLEIQRKINDGRK
jgi:hypothetical protein